MHDSFPHCPQPLTKTPSTMHHTRALCQHSKTPRTRPARGPSAHGPLFFPIGARPVTGFSEPASRPLGQVLPKHPPSVSALRQPWGPCSLHSLGTAWLLSRELPPEQPPLSRLSQTHNQRHLTGLSLWNSSERGSTQTHLSTAAGAGGREPRCLLPRPLLATAGSPAPHTRRSRNPPAATGRAGDRGQHCAGAVVSPVTWHPAWGRLLGLQGSQEAALARTWAADPTASRLRKGEEVLLWKTWVYLEACVLQTLLARGPFGHLHSPDPNLTWHVTAESQIAKPTGTRPVPSGAMTNTGAVTSGQDLPTNHSAQLQPRAITSTDSCPPQKKNL